MPCGAERALYQNGIGTVLSSKECVNDVKHIPNMHKCTCKNNGNVHRKGDLVKYGISLGRHTTTNVLLGEQQ